MTVYGHTYHDVGFIQKAQCKVTFAFERGPHWCMDPLQDCSNPISLTFTKKPYNCQC